DGGPRPGLPVRAQRLLMVGVAGPELAGSLGRPALGPPPGAICGRALGAGALPSGQASPRDGRGGIAPSMLPPGGTRGCRSYAAAPRPACQILPVRRLPCAAQEPGA